MNDYINKKGRRKKILPYKRIPDNLYSHFLLQEGRAQFPPAPLSLGWIFNYIYIITYYIILLHILHILLHIMSFQTPGPASSCCGYFIQFILLSFHSETLAIVNLLS